MMKAEPGWKKEFGNLVRPNARLMDDETEEYLQIADAAQTESLREVARDLQPIANLLDLAATELGGIGLTWVTRPKESGFRLWRDEQGEKESEQLSAVFGNLLMTLANTLITVRLLIRRGFDYQARILLRAFVEHADLAIAVAGDWNTAKDYMASIGADEDIFQAFRKKLSPLRIRSRVSQIERRMGLDEEVTTDLAQTRADIYAWLSLFIHPNRGATIFGAFSSKLEDPETLTPNIGGRASRSSEATALRAVFYTWYLVLSLRRLLHTKHAWLSNPGWQPDDLWLHFRWAAFSALYLSVYEPLTEQILDSRDVEALRTDDA